jgi:hypothetical protein
LNPPNPPIQRRQEADVRRHPFDPVAAVLGIIAVVGGLLVLAGDEVDLDDRGIWWLGLAGLAIAGVLIPWRWPSVERAQPGLAVDAVLSDEGEPSDGSDDHVASIE